MSEFHDFVATPKIMASISKIAQIKVMDLGNGMSGISATQISWGHKNMNLLFCCKVSLQPKLCFHTPKLASSYHFLVILSPSAKI